MPRLRSSSLPPGSVTRAGEWTVVRRRDGSVRAVSSRCRHQLADLSKGSVDKNGCLVCPWHGSRYDLDTGAMVDGPKGFLWYVGRTPGYSGFIKAFASVVKLRRHPVEEVGAELVL